MKNQNLSSYLAQLETVLEEYFGKKAPQLPPNAKEVIVKFAPYLVIISIILAIPALFALIGLSGIATVASPLGGAQSLAAVPGMWISTLLLIPIVVLEAMSISGLMARKAIGWRYLYWSQLVSVLSSILTLNILGVIIGGAIGFYILFQVKNYYK